MALAWQQIQEQQQEQQEAGYHRFSPITPAQMLSLNSGRRPAAAATQGSPGVAPLASTMTMAAASQVLTDQRLPWPIAACN